MSFSRFRSKMTFDSTKPSLLDIFLEEQPPEMIDFDYHVTAVQDSNWKLQDFEEFISKIYSESMDLERPLWRMYVINDMADKRHMLLASVNHAIGIACHILSRFLARGSRISSLSMFTLCGDHCAGDGITLVDVLFRLLDSAAPNAPAGAPLPQPPPPPPPRRAKPLAGMPLSARASAALAGAARGLAGVLLPADPPSALKAVDHRRVGPARRCATSDCISLDEVSTPARDSGARDHRSIRVAGGPIATDIQRARSRIHPHRLGKQPRLDRIADRPFCKALRMADAVPDAGGGGGGGGIICRGAPAPGRRWRSRSIEVDAGRAVSAGRGRGFAALQRSGISPQERRGEWQRR